eukprot:scaffold14974_cov195-Amphora_coffeaeformis.AAC.68
MPKPKVLSLCGEDMTSCADDALISQRLGWYGTKLGREGPKATTGGIPRFTTIVLFVGVNISSLI